MAERKLAMDEELENLDLGEEKIGDDGQEGVVDPPMEDEDDVEEPAEGEAAEEEETPDSAEQAEETKPTQSHADNAAARAARIRAEQETEARLRRQYDEAVAGMGVVNPYTGDTIRSFEDFKAYGEQFRKESLKAEAQRQGKTVEELEAERADKDLLRRLREQERVRQTAQQAEAERRDFMARDLADFVEAFPGVDVAKLEADPKFRKFAGKRLYREPLKELYGDFVELVGQTERAAAAKVAGKRERSTGGGQGGGGVTLSPTQARALEEWNAENPELKMTAKEFLER